MLNLKQDNLSVLDYAIEFHTQARVSRWNAEAQCDAFLLGLAPHIKHQLVSFNLLSSLDGLTELTTHLDRRLQVWRHKARQKEGDRCSSRQRQGPPSFLEVHKGTLGERPEPRQVGQTPLSLEGRE